MVWVTSSGWKLAPLTVQSVCGAFAFVTSASTGLLEACITTRASDADGVPVHVADSAAQAGTEIGLGSGLGEAGGLGDGLGVGVGLGLGEGLAACEGELCATRGPLAEQPATAARAHRRTTPFLTGGCNEIKRPTVTAVLSCGKSPRIPPGR